MRPDPYQKKKSRAYQAKHATVVAEKPKLKALPSNHDKYDEPDVELEEDEQQETIELMEMLAKAKLDQQVEPTGFQFKNEKVDTMDINVDLLKLAQKLENIPLHQLLGLDSPDIYSAMLHPQPIQETHIQEKHEPPYIVHCDEWMKSVFVYPNLNSESLSRQEAAVPKPEAVQKTAVVQKVVMGQTNIKPEKPIVQETDVSEVDMLDELLAGTPIVSKIPQKQAIQLTSQEDDDFFNELLK
jgi:hypothetical protein